MLTSNRLARYLFALSMVGSTALFASLTLSTNAQTFASDQIRVERGNETNEQFAKDEKRECEWTNDNIAKCIVYKCDLEGICIEDETHCVDHHGRRIPCP